MSRHPLHPARNTGAGSAFLPTFQKEMNRLFEQFKSGFPTWDEHEHAPFTGPAFPAIDVIETDDAVEISAEVPGVKPNDLDVSIAGDTLVLKGTKSAEHEEKDDQYRLVERHYGSFRRQIPLGFAPGDDAVDANFAEGILKLRIVKPATAQTDLRKIDIKTS